MEFDLFLLEEEEEISFDRQQEALGIQFEGQDFGFGSDY
jgi:hypothetical protein